MKLAGLVSLMIIDLSLGHSYHVFFLGRFDESKRTNMNQLDFATAIDCLIAKDGVDSDIWKTNQDDLTKVKPTNQDYIIYQQYESGLHPVRQFIEFSQSAKVVVHMELFEARTAIERLVAPQFVMYENLSADTGPRSQDLTRRKMNNFVAVLCTYHYYKGISISFVVFCF